MTASRRRSEKNVAVTLDPQSRRWLDQWPPIDPMAPQPTVAQLRDAIAVWPTGPQPQVHEVFDATAAANGLDVPVRVYRPSEHRDLPAVVYVHGGGWVAGTLDVVDGFCRRMALAAGAVVISVGYRLAPEHPFPEPLDDVVAAFRWVTDQPQSLGIDPSRVAIVGESAGGNLAAAAALRTRTEGGRQPLHQLLLYPVLDHDFDRPSMVANADGFGLTRAAMAWFWDCYVPDLARRDDPYASPVRAGVAALAGVAPATVVTAGFDPLRDEADEYAAKLADAGVPVTHLTHPDMIHGFVALADSIDRGREGWDAVMAVLRSALHSAPS